MDTDKLKKSIREALGGAGIPREITEQIDRIIDQETGDKKAAEHPKLRTRAVAEDNDEDDDDDDPPVRRIASVTASARKVAPRKKR
jgi:hypothetical protein